MDGVAAALPDSLLRVIARYAVAADDAFMYAACSGDYDLVTWALDALRAPPRVDVVAAAARGGFENAAVVLLEHCGVARGELMRRLAGAEVASTAAAGGCTALTLNLLALAPAPLRAHAVAAALPLACTLGREEVVAALLSTHGDAIKPYTARGALIAACRHAPESLVRRLLPKGDRVLAFREICRAGREDLAIALKDKLRITRVDLDTHGGAGAALYVMCLGGCTALVSRFIGEFKLERSDFGFGTQRDCLAAACKGGHEELARMLMSRFKPTQFEIDEGQVLAEACASGKTSFVLELDAQFGTRVKLGLLHEACRCGHTELALKLLAKVDLKLHKHSTFVEACRGGNEELVFAIITTLGLTRSDLDLAHVLLVICQRGWGRVLLGIMAKLGVTREEVLMVRPIYCAAGSDASSDFARTIISELKMTREEVLVDKGESFRQACKMGDKPLAAMLATELKMTNEEVYIDGGQAFVWAAVNSWRSRLVDWLISEYPPPRALAERALSHITTEGVTSFIIGEYLKHKKD